ncbi:MAG TPA: MFS transporter [Opitutaceae bacterium]|nr:MFS transporter [Opitutaceae bacterium]
MSDSLKLCRNPSAMTNRQLATLIIVSSLGYFVDAYDLIIFSAVRTHSLADLGVSAADSLNVGLSLLNFQMFGLLLGGIVFGMLGDKRGRLTVLFGSISLYSIANILNGLVQTIAQYKAMRFLAGFGLAGELGAAIAIVSEVMKTDRRTLGTMAVGTFGFLGAAVAGLVGTSIPWRLSFIIGGVMGLVLLGMRLGLAESGLYARIRNEPVVKGNWFYLFSNRGRFFRYLRCIGAGLPTYFVVGVLATGAPELGRALGLATPPVAGIALLVCYLAMSAGNIACSMFSQVLRSRRVAIMTFNVIVLVGVLAFGFLPTPTAAVFYAKCGLLGFGCGFWALVATNAAEQFGTNMRATVAITVPNFIRGALVPIAFLFTSLREVAGLLPSAVIVGAATACIGFLSMLFSEETFRRNLDVVEM